MNRGRSDNGETALLQAADQGFHEIVAVLIEAGADVDKPRDDGCTPLYMAAAFGRVEAVRVLLEQGSADVNKVNNNSQTPINVAADGGHLEVVKLLLEKGPDLSIKDKWGDMPRASALAKGHAEVAELLS